MESNEIINMCSTYVDRNARSVILSNNIFHRSKSISIQKDSPLTSSVRSDGSKIR